MRITTAAGVTAQTTIRTTPSGTTTSQRSGSFAVGFTKPDEPIINPKINGYRKPSSYSCPGFKESTYTSTRGNALPVKYSLDGFAENERLGYQWTFSGTSQFSVAYTSLNPSVDELRMKLLNKVREEVLDVAMVLAEATSSADTISNGLLRVGRAMENVGRKNPHSYWYLLTGRRLDRRRPTDKFLRETSSLFLEWKYGIMPTVYDIEAASAALDMTNDGSLFKHPPLLVKRQSVIEKSTDVYRTSAVEASGDSDYVYVPIQTERQLHARCDYRVSGEGLRGLNRFGIGLSSIATVAYDKTPFSFVLNMGFPLAELIKAWTALAGVEVVGYCETDYTKAFVPSGSQSVQLRGGTAICKWDECKYVSWKRTAYSSPPMPMPHLRNPIKVSNLQTVLALFTQLRKPSRLLQT